MNKMLLFTIQILLTFTILIASLINASVIVSRPLECECYYANATETEFCVDTKIQCEPDKGSHCFVLWALDNVTGKSIVNMKGCFTNNQACNQTECIDYSEKAKRGHNFCCCESNMCNTEQKWIPTTSPKPQEIELPKRSEHKTVLIVLCGIAGIALISVFGIFGVCYFKNRKTAMFNEVPTVEPEISASTLALNTPRPIDLVDIIARGRFGVVWRGILKHEVEVAVKIFPLQDKDSWASEQEIFKLPRMKHPNILEFIGVERHTNNCQQEFWLITCYHERGSLCDYLKSHTITWNELCKIAETMARGLMHLHEEIPATKGDELKPAIAHRDFKSKNVLLKHDLTACIADFGLALIFEPGKPCGDTHGQVGTRRYMAPEVLEGAINFTRDAFLRIDVYACGLVLWELVSRCTINDIHVGEYALPFEKEFNSNGKHPTLEEMQDNVVTKKLRPKINNQWRAHNGLNAICDTMEECWDHDAEARLSSSCVMERIQHHTRYPMTPLLIETNTNTTTMTKDPINNTV